MKWLFASGKAWHQKWWVYVIIPFSVAVLIAIPFFIDFAYIRGRSLPQSNTYFTAGDWLSFYGTILGALATIFVLIITLKHNVRIIQLNMKEQRIRENYQKEKQVAEDVLDVVMLKKYGDSLFIDNKSLMQFMQDINSVYFETLARVPLNTADKSNKANFYRKVYEIHKLYKKKIDALNIITPQNAEQAKAVQCEIDQCKKAIVHIKNEYQTDVWFLAKGLYFSINQEMNAAIDKLYGVKESGSNDQH